MHAAWQQRGEQWCPPCHEVHHQTCGENNVRAPEHGWTVQVRATFLFHVICHVLVFRSEEMYSLVLSLSPCIKRDTMAQFNTHQLRFQCGKKLVVNYVADMYRNNRGTE